MLKDEIDVASGLLVVDEVDDVGMFDDWEDLYLLPNSLQALFFDVFDFDLFDCIGDPICNGFKYLRIAAFSYLS